MKTTALILCLCFLAAHCFAVNVSSFGTWNDTSVWASGRVPADNDSVVIPPGKSITVDSDMRPLKGVYVKVYGELMVEDGAALRFAPDGIVEVFSGGAISGKGSIVIGGHEVWKGSEGAMDGPITCSGPGCANYHTLAVGIISASLELTDEGVLVSWSSEKESSGATIVLKSYDFHNWRETGIVENAESQSFLDTEVEPEKTAYYRLMQRDLNGNEEYYHEELEIFVPAVRAEQIAVYPNPACGKVNVQVPKDWKNAHLTIFTLAGKGDKVRMELSEGINHVHLDGMEEGLYFVGLVSENGNSVVEQLIIQN